ncbi:MAG: carboxypeptidase-like regulatory domain-containing protein, partial [Bacteroidetes bacterium]|nr:carboxypeptidase-like regulatory domain-containing protein [Bacteroidota bacterium]
MKINSTLFLFLLISSSVVSAQTIKVSGKIINTRLEPLAFVTVQVKEIKRGTVTKEDGTYELMMDEGKYDLVISMIGYKSRVVTIIVGKSDLLQNIILEPDDSKDLSEVVVKGRIKDRSEEIIKNVIRNKGKIQAAAGAYSCKVYIKATQEDSMAFKKKRKPVPDSLKANADLLKMAMVEIYLKYDHETDQRVKEERLGVTKRGNANRLFYLSTTEGNFDFYNNLVKVPVVSQTPFLSPISYSGLLAYKFKMLKIENRGTHKIYTISVKPRQLSNATVEGELTIMDSAWVLLHTKFSLPKYHLPEYDFFEVEQQYEFIDDTAWMITRQNFTYFSKSGRASSTGQTIVTYKDFELNKQFDKKYFGVEVSTTDEQAYERDSSFWQQTRTEPLSDREMRFIRYKDSVYLVTHAKAYLDSLDDVTNKITWKKIFLFGQTFSNYEKERQIYITSIPSMYQPFQFGGSRIMLMSTYSKTYKSRKNISMFNQVSYGLRNHDVNGSINFTRMYNPFNRGFYSISAGRDFQAIFSGDAWINMIKRSNIYLNNAIGIGHGLELLNGLFFYSNFDIAFRRSVSDYKTNPKVDSLFGDILTNNQAISFEAYNAVYGKLRLQYTPFQKYIREPKEKIILGSAWPTFYTTWRKGMPGVFRSKVNFDYLEFGIEQSIHLGLLGISS